MSTELNITAEFLRSLSFRPIHAGDDYAYKFTLTLDGDPIDLTDAKAWFTVKESTVKTDAEAKLQLTSADPDEIEITDALNGELLVKFSGEATGDLEGQWLYDLQIKALIDGAEKIITVAWGAIEFLPNLTRAIL